MDISDRIRLLDGNCAVLEDGHTPLVAHTRIDREAVLFRMAEVTVAPFVHNDS